MSAGLESLGVSPRAQCVLTQALSGEHTQIELARKIGLDKTTMVVTIDELERLGLAERRPSKTDRRARVIVVTKAGKEKVREGKRVADRIRREVLETLPEDQREPFLQALAGLVHGRYGDGAIGCGGKSVV
jgi:MarR family transcriptional regulator for hemolysin